MMNRIFKVITLSVLLLVLFIIPAQAQYDFTRVTSTLISGSYTDFIVSGTTGFAIEAYGVKSFDISDPTDPTQTGEVATLGGARAAVQVGNYLFIADAINGLTVVSVADPGNMSLVAERDLGGFCRAITTNGTNYLFCTVEGVGMKVVNITNPVSPIVFPTTLVLPADAYAARYLNNYVYMACGDSGLVIANVTSPAAPTWASTTPGPAAFYGLAVNGGLNQVYAVGDLGITVIDVFNPTAPVVITTYMTQYTAVHITYNENYAAVTEHPATGGVVEIFDYSVGWILLGSYTAVGMPNLTTLSGAYAYVAEGVTGFEVLNMTTPANPTQEGIFEEFGGPRTAVKVGQYAYVANYSGGMEVVDLSDPTNPNPGIAIPAVIWCYDVVVDGNYAYSIDWSGMLKVMNTTTPSNPTVVGTLPDHTNMRSVAKYEHYLYVGTYDYGVRVFNVENPTSPSFVTQVDIAANCKGVTVYDDLLLVSATELGVRIYSLTNPEVPTLQGTAPTVGAARMVDVDGDYMYVAADTAGVKIFNISNPASPMLLSTIPFATLEDDARGVTFIGGKLYVAHTSSGMSCFDVSTPSAPAPFGSLDNPGLAYEVTGWDADYVLLSDTYSLEVIQQVLTGVKPETQITPSSFTFEGNFPNPFNPATSLRFSLPTSGQVTVAIYDASGRLALVPFRGVLAQGEHRLNVNMEQFSSGVYLAKVTSAQGQISKSIVLLK